MSNFQVLANTEDSDYALPTLDWWFGRFRPGRFDRVAVTSVDTANKVFSGSGPGGVTISGAFGDFVPITGEVWWCLRNRGGEWVAYDKAAGG